jgi:multisubunit Na+/H+ antiporter MnhF subunit
VSPFLVGSLITVAVLIAVSLYRVWAGPTVFDRLVAIALVSVNGVIVLVVLGFVLERPALFLDIALAYALLAFLLPIALGRYFEERDDGTSRDGERGQLYSADEDRADSDAFLERGKGDRHQFRFIVSPEDGADLTDLTAHTRDLMSRIESDLGTRLDWVAVNHYNTGHPHTHILVRGHDERGKSDQRVSALTWNRATTPLPRCSPVTSGVPSASVAQLLAVSEASGSART